MFITEANKNPPLKELALSFVEWVRRGVDGGGCLICTLQF